MNVAAREPKLQRLPDRPLVMICVCNEPLALAGETPPLFTAGTPPTPTGAVVRVPGSR